MSPTYAKKEIKNCMLSREFQNFYVLKNENLLWEHLLNLSSIIVLSCGCSTTETLNNKINKLHERALRIVYRNNELSFQEILDKDNSVTVHQRNLRKLAIEMFKVNHNLSPLPMRELFAEHTNTRDLKNKRSWELPNTRTVTCGKETIRYRWPKTWDLSTKWS